MGLKGDKDERVLITQVFRCMYMVLIIFELSAIILLYLKLKVQSVEVKIEIRPEIVLFKYREEKVTQNLEYQSKFIKR